MFVAPPALDRAGVSQAAAVVPAGAYGAKPGGGRGADRDFRAAQPAAYAGTSREVAGLWFNALPVRRREREFEPAVVRQPHIDPADFLAVDLDRAGVEPAVVPNAGGEVAQAWQHALPAARLPSELSATIIKATRNDAPGLLVVALCGGARQVEGDGRGDDRDG